MEHKIDNSADNTAQIEIPEELLAMQKKKNARRNILLAAAAGVLLIVAVVIGVWLLNAFSLDIALHGDGEITVDCADTFTDPGASARLSATILTMFEKDTQVQVQGTVNTAVPGTYELTYSAQTEVDYYFGKLSFQDTKKRTIHVVDTTAPKIVLLKDPDYFTLPGREYQEEGYVAADLCDGGLTDQVKRWQDGDWVFYQVTDSSGNTALEKRQIIYSDPIAPELVLEGKQEHVVVVGNKYKEPGFTAIDNCDGDITAQVTVTGKVDHRKMGTYPLEYTVTDNFGNVTTVTRTVIVRDYPELPDNLFPGQAEEPVKPEGKVIYLTFDDGPSSHTEYLLDVLKKYNVKATFFVLNKGRHDTLKRIAAEGHTLALHGSSHNYKQIYSSEEAFFKDLKKIQDIVYEQTGQISTIVRFPGGSSNTVSRFNPGIMTRLTKMLNAMDYRYFDWAVSSGDASGAKTVDEIYQNVINGVGKRKVAVVLQHDTNIVSVLAVEKIIKWGLANGYTFLPLTNDSPICRHGLNN